MPRNDYSLAEGNYVLYAGTESGVVSGLGIPADWNTISRYRSDLARAIETGEPIDARMLPSGILTELLNNQLSWDNALVLSVSDGTVTTLKPHGQMGGWSAEKTTGVGNSAWGLLGTVGYTGPTLGANDADGLYLTVRTGGLNTNAGIGGNTASYSMDRQGNFRFRAKFKFVDTADVRVFIGLANTSLGGIMASDNPAFSTVGVQFSTARGDTDFQLVSSDGVSQNVKDTGIAVDTNAHWVVIKASNSPASFTVGLYSTSYVRQAETVFVSNIPASGTGMGPLYGIRNLDAATKDLKGYTFFGVLNP